MEVLDWIVRNGQLLSSPSALDEFTTRFSWRAKFDRYVTFDERRAFAADVADAVEMVAVTTHLAVCADPDDDKFLELAVDGRADCVVTGNTRDFPAEHTGIPVLTPAQFAGRYVAAA